MIPILNLTLPLPIIIHLSVLVNISTLSIINPVFKPHYLILSLFKVTLTKMVNGNESLYPWIISDVLKHKYMFDFNFSKQYNHFFTDIVYVSWSFL